MNTPSHSTSLAAAWAYRSQRTTVRLASILSLLLGGLSFLLGFILPPSRPTGLLNAIYLVLGLWLLSGGIAGLTLRRHVSIVVLGMGLIVFGLWNIALPLLNARSGGSLDLIAIAIALLPLSIGVKTLQVLRKHTDAPITSASKEALARIDASLRVLLQQSEKDVDNMIELFDYGRFRFKWKGLLMDPEIVLLNTTTLQIRVLSKPLFTIAVLNHSAPNQIAAVDVHMGKHMATAKMSSTALHRYTHWNQDGSEL